jgi:hypothetical protein
VRRPYRIAFFKIAHAIGGTGVNSIRSFRGCRSAADGKPLPSERDW